MFKKQIQGIDFKTKNYNKEKAMFHNFYRNGIQSQNELHCLYAVYICCDMIPQLDRRQLVIYQTILFWFKKQHRKELNFIHRLNNLTVSRILTLLSLQIQSNHYGSEGDKGTAFILSLLDEVVRQSYDYSLKTKFTQCITQLYEHNYPIQLEVYAKMLIQDNEMIKQFSILACDVLSGQIDVSISLVEIIIDGISNFGKRYKKIKQSQITFEDKQIIQKICTHLSGFLARNQATNWPMKIHTENPDLIQNLLQLCYKNIGFLIFYELVNQIIEVFIKCSLQNYLKFELILSIYKFIISKGSKIFSFILTDNLSHEVDFLEWFISKELKIQNSFEIISDYFSNSEGLQFLLVIVIYYLYSHPPETYNGIYNIMNSLQLLEESKYLLQQNKNVHEYMKIYFNIMGQSEIYQSFLSTIETAQIRISLR